MAIVRRSSAQIRRDLPRILEEFAKHKRPSEEEIERQAAEDGDAWQEGDFENATLVYPPPKPEQVKAVRERLGLTQADFAHRFGFRLDTLQQYEQGRRTPSGPAATLLRVIAANPDAVTSALRQPFPDAAE
ncbi:MAG: helix-turn-helix domain-containing protein [Proteobacteria bacterium]|nr:helix-turn-helix domain-containing protein [Pseudomonadota bacterium]